MPHSRIPLTSGATLVNAGSETIAGTLATTGVTTPIGGVAPAGGTTIVLARPGCIHTGGVPSNATGNGVDATPVNTEIYYSEFLIPCTVGPVTGIAFHKGSIVNTDSVHMAILDADGALVSGTATGAVAIASTVDVYQKVPFTDSLDSLAGPATYYVAIIFSGNTDRYNAHGDATLENCLPQNMVAGKITSQTYGAIPSTNALTLTFTKDLGPIASLY